jgi:hypothetical protein
VLSQAPVRRACHQVFDRCLERNPRLKAALEREALLPSTDEQKAQYGKMASPPQAVKRRVTLVRGGGASITRSHSRGGFFACVWGVRLDSGRVAQNQEGGGGERKAVGSMAAQQAHGHHARPTGGPPCCGASFVVSPKP